MAIDPETFGASIGGSRWFAGAPTLIETPVQPVRVTWACPMNDGGEMVFNGMTWPTGTPGYHHTCTVCRFTAALSGKKFPIVEYR